MARVRTLERYLSAFSDSTPVHQIEPRKIFSIGSDSSLELSLTSSECSRADSLDMQPLTSQIEGEISVGMISLNIEERKSCSLDSFSSEPDTVQNKGAIAFLHLVEAAIEKHQDDNMALQFENLVVEMMDLNVGKKFKTSEDIASTLIENGWNAREVASIWTVSPTTDAEICWND